MCFLVNIAKFLKKLVLKKICERLLLNNLKRNYSSMKIVKQVVNFLNIRVSFLINIVVACILSLSLFRKRFPRWCFPESYPKFLTTAFLKREKKHCYKIRGSDIYRKSNYATFYVTSLRFLYFSKQLAQFIVTTGYIQFYQLKKITESSQ